MSKNIVPKESLEWFKRKGIKPSFDYRDVWKEEHANAFTVAKMLNADLLVEVKQLVEQAIA
ncbi:MAG: phage minor head protein, partial [Vibrio sp.]